MSTAEKMQEWSKYLSEEDFSFLVNFVENAKLGLKQTEPILIVRGPRSTGKSTLMRKIAEIVGEDNCVKACSIPTTFRPSEFGRISKDKYPHLYYMEEASPESFNTSLNSIAILLKHGSPLKVSVLYERSHILKADPGHACSCVFVMLDSSEDFVLKSLSKNIKRYKTIQLTHVFKSLTPC